MRACRSLCSDLNPQCSPPCTPQVSKMLDKKIAVTDPYYIKGTRYKGVPRYMDETKVRQGPGEPRGAIVSAAATCTAALV